MLLLRRADSQTKESANSAKRSLLFHGHLPSSCRLRSLIRSQFFLVSFWRFSKVSRFIQIHIQIHTHTEEDQKRVLIHKSNATAKQRLCSHIVQVLKTTERRKMWGSLTRAPDTSRNCKDGRNDDRGSPTLVVLPEERDRPRLRWIIDQRLILGALQVSGGVIRDRI